jgi:hypothetical protein
MIYLKKMMKSTLPFVITSRKIIYLGINITKEVKCLFTEKKKKTSKFPVEVRSTLTGEIS